jgi:hypothetical protein
MIETKNWREKKRQRAVPFITKKTVLQFFSRAAQAHHILSSMIHTNRCISSRAIE